MLKSLYETYGQIDKVTPTQPESPVSAKNSNGKIEDDPEGTQESSDKRATEAAWGGISILVGLPASLACAYYWGSFVLLVLWGISLLALLLVSKLDVEEEQKKNIIPLLAGVAVIFFGTFLLWHLAKWLWTLF